MQSLPKDTLFEIMHHITDSELTKLCQVDKTFSQLCRDDNFWKQRGITKFGKEFTVLANKSALPSYKEVYILALDLSFLLSFLPKSEYFHTIVELYELEFLNLFDNQLAELPKEIGRLKNVKSINLLKNQLVALPKEIGQLSNLQDMIASNNLLTTLPKEIGQLRQLRTLDLYKNEIVKLPKEIGQLQNLETLTLSHNRLVALPKEIGQLKKLRSLDLYINELVALPKEIGQLSNLRSLYIHDNKLSNTSIQEVKKNLPNTSIVS